jgi:hypothetical protein
MEELCEKPAKQWKNFLEKPIKQSKDYAGKYSKQWKVYVGTPIKGGRIILEKTSKRMAPFCWKISRTCKTMEGFCFGISVTGFMSRPSTGKVDKEYERNGIRGCRLYKSDSRYGSVGS